MKLAILFWFYKEPEICKNRLELLRQSNPETPIYGLYGGDLKSVDQYKPLLTDYLDDLYIFTSHTDPLWKWLQGDLMITQWYRDRGKDLVWDTIVIVQWDMLVFDSVEHLFSTLKKDQILLSGLRPIKEVENDWEWVAPKIPERREQYLNFLKYVREVYNYNQDPMGCLFIVACFPKIFLDQYSQINQPQLGFLEYRIPIYAQIFGISFCENHSFQAWWVDADPVFWTKNPIKRAWNSLQVRLAPNPLNPAKREISLIPIYRHLKTEKGARIFHPYERLFPQTKQQWVNAIFNEFRRDFNWLFQKLGVSRLLKLVQ
ncbi:hypothetical protein J5X98_06730 [Leptothermofonsia sichuanensis E412]|uniref:hypothetical protein n=1 Tax=Leptothermofonsia sichuanensis TaxID=2917832 RepID=UPI001CA65A94|nr:hypothetical protein [Leptothermofonsia sichuanensis]QZZ22089.1 hypothetical protein J5X98_06730 [Leptothermofonsia sichuanensis E412]